MTDGLVLCGVDATDAGTTVMAAAKATGAPLLLVHVSNSLWGTRIPAFTADTGTQRLVDHGPVGPRLLTIAKAHGAGMIVLGTRGKRWQSVARYVHEARLVPGDDRRSRGGSGGRGGDPARVRSRPPAPLARAGGGPPQPLMGIRPNCRTGVRHHTGRHVALLACRGRQRGGGGRRRARARRVAGEGHPAPMAEGVEVLVGGTVLVIVVNVLLLRRVFGPLERLTGR